MKPYKKIKLSSGEVALIDKSDMELVSNHNWCNNSSGYAGTSKNGKTLLMHRLIMNPPKGLVVDHLNYNTMDNRRKNLRICTASENSYNRKKTTSKYRGVHLYKGKWMARIRLGGDTVYLGYFKREKEAGRAYDIRAVREFGNDAVLNFGG